MLKPDKIISIIVPNLDGGDGLIRAIESAVSEMGDSSEVIVVDNGSSDGSPEKAAAAFQGASILRNPDNKGFAEACNQGAKNSSGRFLLFLNNDAEFRHGSLRLLVETAEGGSREEAVWQPLNLTPQGTVDSAGDLFTWWGFFLHLRESPPSGAIFAAKGPALLVRREVLEELGGFDSSFFAYFEESDLCWRARLAGYEVRCVSESEVIHIGGATTRRVFSPHQIRYLSFRNRLRTILANASAPNLLRIVPLHILGCIGSALAFGLRGRVRSSVAVLAAMLWPLTHSSLLMEHRRRAQALRRIPDSLVLRSHLIASLRPDRAFRMLRGQLGRWEASA